ncbi:hypothetical protein E1B28_002127 [Marasmius oreades]|uniref:Uncharacterized protein n=1 Tax=Marasmius oreades TaxID=181124 RepID=A0A9P7RN16_9AGAR|nr:uncharacterized protein E1B28_002127 [Marasmius oreades]KAG7086166.1 hypothetical protein E1B28_002127 [Marasmius oreades]
MSKDSKRPASSIDSEDESVERKVRRKVEIKNEKAAAETSVSLVSNDMGRDLQALQIQNNQIQELINKQLKAFADTQKKLAQEREESVLENAALKSENERMKNMVEKEWMDKLQAAKNEAKGMRQENETLKQELKDKLRAAENKAKGMKQENETLKQELELLKNWKSKMNQLKGDLDTLFNMDSAQIQAPSVDPVRTQKNAPPVLRGVNGTSSQGTPSEQPTVRHVQQIVDNSESQPRPQSSPLSRLTNSGGRDARVKFVRSYPSRHSCSFMNFAYIFCRPASH